MPGRLLSLIILVTGATVRWLVIFPKSHIRHYLRDEFFQMNIIVGILFYLIIFAVLKNMYW